MARIFVAAWPPDNVAEALTALPRPEVGDLRWVPRENLHVTLRFLGDTPPGAVAARLGAAQLPPATVALGPTVSMLGERVVMAPAVGLDALAAAVVEATADLGRPPPHRPFVGHVTLARCRSADTCRRATGTPIDLAFAVQELVVVQSDTRPDGARYSPVARVALSR